MKKLIDENNEKLKTKVKRLSEVVSEYMLNMSASKQTRAIPVGINMPPKSCSLPPHASGEITLQAANEATPKICEAYLH